MATGDSEHEPRPRRDHRERGDVVVADGGVVGCTGVGSDGQSTPVTEGLSGRQRIANIVAGEF